jgi:hypothetical protein
MSTMTLNISWKVRSTWTQASKNTFWCLLGCSIGDFGTIFFFQYNKIAWPVMGIITSIILETFILSRQMALNLAFKTAIGMSLISMISMEVTMNVTDVLLTGGAKLTWWVIPIMLIVGFLTPLPYNYWRLQALNKSCH